MSSVSADYGTEDHVESLLLPVSSRARDVVRVGLKVVGLNKRFGERWAARNLSLEVPKGKLLVLLGPSGSGKSSTLNMIAGFLSPDSGRVIVDGDDLTEVPTHRRSFGMVFQASTLFPHLTVAGNIEYGLRLRKAPGAHRRERLAEMLAMIGLEGRESAYPAQLSGGEQQRVALARALAVEPRLLLLDEPLSSLDAKLRRQIREEIRTIQVQREITTVMVTHDQEEALAIGDIVAVIDQGALQQADTPENVYRNPVNAFVAGFVGENNLLSGVVVEARHDRVAVRLESGLTVMGGPAAGELSKGDRALVVIRPDEAVIRPIGQRGPNVDTAEWNSAAGAVRMTQFLGARRRCVVDLEPGPMSLEVDAPPYSSFRSGDRVEVRWRVDGSRIMPQRHDEHTHEAVS